MVFMICLIIALMMWIVVKLSQEDASLIKYPVDYTGLPEGKVITSLSSRSLLLDIDLMGTDLIRQKFFKSHTPLIISVKDLPIRKQDSREVIPLATAPLVRDIERQLGVMNAVNKISPDTVYIGLSPQ